MGINKEDGGFEKMIPSPRMGGQPNKSAMQFADESKMTGLMSDLKSSHFTMGKESGARYTANIHYGNSVG